MIHAKRNIKLRFGIAEALFLNFITEKNAGAGDFGRQKNLLLHYRIVDFTGIFFGSIIIMKNCLKGGIRIGEKEH